MFYNLEVNTFYTLIVNTNILYDTFGPAFTANSTHVLLKVDSHFSFS